MFLCLGIVDASGGGGDPLLAEIDLPVLVFWEQQDQLLLVDNAHRVCKMLRRSKLHIFEQCGHFSYQDQCEQFARLVIDWVSGQHKTV